MTNIHASKNYQSSKIKVAPCYRNSGPHFAGIVALCHWNIHFGDKKNKNWTQTLENKQKNRFFNPIWQNKAHITALKLVVGIENDSLYKSYMVFSERCTLKKINVVSPNIKVIKRNQLNKTIKADIKNSPQLLTTEEIVRLYFKLQKYTHADAQVKKAHIDNIKNRRIRRSKYG